MRNNEGVRRTLGTHRIAFYIRVSTEEQASNPEGSIKSQEQRLRTHVALKNQEGNFGEITSVFIDRAKSGKNTNRPELQKLLQAVRNQEVTLVMVSELSRLSRSIKDFCEMWELMRSCGCEFQSLREQFDTTNAAGEMVLFTIANIAQFERRQVAERVTANLQARSARGLYNGGIIPYGFRRDPVKKGHLIVHREEAKVIRTAFSFFLKEKSLTAAASLLNRKGFQLSKQTLGGGYRPRLGHFTIGNLHTILRNKAYIGIKAYAVNGTPREAKAVWEPIVDCVTFLRVQQLLTKNYGRRKPDSPQRYPFLLSSIVYCATCGDRLCGKSANGNGGKIPYYEHAWATKRQACLVKKVFSCNPNRVLAKRLEEEIWGKVHQLLTEPKLAEELFKEANAVYQQRSGHKDSERVKEKIQGITRQLEALAERLAELPTTVSATPIYKQMEKLGELKAQAAISLQEQGENKVFQKPVELAGFQEFLRGMTKLAGDPQGQRCRAEIIQRIIHKVEIMPDTYRLHFNVSSGSNTLTVFFPAHRLQIIPGTSFTVDTTITDYCPGVSQTGHRWEKIFYSLRQSIPACRS